MVRVWGINSPKEHILFVMSTQRSSQLAGTKIGNGKAGLQIEDSEINDTVLDVQIASAESQRPNKINKQMKSEGSRVW